MAYLALSTPTSFHQPLTTLSNNSLCISPFLLHLVFLKPKTSRLLFSSTSQNSFYFVYNLYSAHSIPLLWITLLSSLSLSYSYPYMFFVINKSYLRKESQWKCIKGKVNWILHHLSCKTLKNFGGTVEIRKRTYWFNKSSDVNYLTMYNQPSAMTFLLV